MNQRAQPQAPSLCVSVVVYHSAPSQLRNTLHTLLAAVEAVQHNGMLGAAQIDIVNNGGVDPKLALLKAELEEAANRQSVALKWHEGQGNIGYGRGHNLSILASNADYHLVLNPDVELTADSLSQGLQFMQANREVVALSPAVSTDDGRKQYVCKRFPSVFDFLLRGFGPAFVKRQFQRRLAHYEMQDLPEDQASTDIPIISGCFMLFAGAGLRAVGGFDERYFLYFEDFDLSLRVHRQGALAYLPTMHIVHHGGNSARKGWRHIGMFARSGLRFYNTHGWRFF